MLSKFPNVTYALACVLAAGFGAASAQEPRYSSDWRTATPDAAAPVRAVSDDTTQQMVDELSALVESAAAANAGDPRFLQDLRDLALRYAWPWRTRLISEDFGDGDFTQNPEWTVVSGSFAIEPGEGLRTRTSSGATPPSTAEPSTEELAISILGSILSGGSEERESSNSEPLDAPAQIVLQTPIPSDFAIRLEISSAGGSGPFELGVAQGEDRLGYRLAYTSGTSGGSMALLRYGSRGVSVIDATVDNVSLEDGESHLLQMTRSDAGEFVVSVDGAELIRVVDRAFRDPFEDFIVTNQGGDYLVHALTIFGS